VKLADWRRAAAEQDREQKEQLGRYLEHKALEQRVTLTTKGYRKVRELDREAEDGAQISAGEHSPPTKTAARRSLLSGGEYYGVGAATAVGLSQRKGSYKP
jgi:hypothetical protein